MYDAEHRIVQAIPKLVKAATCPELKKALEAHLLETEGQVIKLEKVFDAFEEKAKGKPCAAMKGLLEEGDEIATSFKGSPAINAALISAGQKVEHYEIASYGCLREWAALLGNEKAAGLLQEILDQEKAANATLSRLAQDGCNDQALGESNEKESEATDKSSGKSSHFARPSGATGVRAVSPKR